MPGPRGPASHQIMHLRLWPPLGRRKQSRAETHLTLNAALEPEVPSWLGQAPQKPPLQAQRFPLATAAVASQVCDHVRVRRLCLEQGILARPRRSTLRANLEERQRGPHPRLSSLGCEQHTALDPFCLDGTAWPACITLPVVLKTKAGGDDCG